MSELSRELSELAGTWNVLHSQIALPVGVSTQLCVANPLRWALVVAKTSPTSAAGQFPAISTDPNVGANGGLDVANPDHIEIDYRKLGALAQQAWYGTGVGASADKVDVWEVLAQP